MKPIEPGCLAMIVGATAAPENNGKVVRVLECIGSDLPPHPAGFNWSSHLPPYWSIYPPIVSQLGYSQPFAPEVKILRVDGYDPTEEDLEQVLDQPVRGAG